MFLCGCVCARGGYMSWWQPTPLRRSSALLWTCTEGNLPPLTKNIFIPSNITANAIMAIARPMVGRIFIVVRVFPLQM